MKTIAALHMWEIKPGRMILITAVLLFFLVAGCTGPQAVVERMPAGEVLFKDDFSDPTSGWDRISAPTGETNYVNGAYRIWVNEPYTDLFTNPNLDFGDVRIEVETAKANGTDDNVFGVICRSNPIGDQYYFFVISSDGYYGIGKVDGPDQALLSAEKLMPSEAIHQKKQTNLLRAECVGSRLTFYANGQLLVEVEDASYAQGDIGLTAGSFGEPDVDILFDNLVATKP
jgi:hypothetical protein